MTNHFIKTQSKTALIFVGVFVMIILPVNYLIYSNVKNILVEADTKELKSEGERILSRVKTDPPIVPLPPVGYLVYLQAGNEIQKDSIFASPGFPVEVKDFHQPVIEYDTLKFVGLSRPLEYGNGELTLYIGRSNQHQFVQIKELRLYLFVANLGSILIAGLLVYLVSGYTLRPILKIIEAAQNINAAKSIERVPVPSTEDENRQLAVTINDMLTRIENSIQIQTNFFASAAHELRTPLTVMKAELTLVQKESRWHEMLKEVERLERTVNDFLMISQLKSESLLLRKKSVELSELLYVALKKIKYLSEEKNTTVRIELEQAENIFVEADEDKLENVIINLLENAIKYSPEGTVVDVLLKMNPRASIEIKNSITQPIDNPDQFKREFSKAEVASPGLGMGLWIANKIVLLHNGQLHLKSNALWFSAIIIFD
ncbi:MAG: HAMP domain-containing histidine kinase [Bacteroidetes bacterium]|nr:HAMP domain-containing histidine kinase [Bacteroidota bacterium]